MNCMYVFVVSVILKLISSIIFAICLFWWVLVDSYGLIWMFSMAWPSSKLDTVRIKL